VTLRPLRLPVGYRPEPRETVGSTNDEARQLARNGAADGTVVWALEQTAGRGRRGRRWASPRGNLYASLLLRPVCPPDRAAQLGFAASLAIGDMLGELVPGIVGLACKWPNDVLLAGHKIAGILLESEASRADAPNFLIVGVGVNLASAPADAEFPAISLAAAGYPAPEPASALEAFVQAFAIWARLWRDQGFPPLREAWLARATGLGERICVRLDNAILYGKFVDIDQQGTMLLETGSGFRRVTAGDVFPAG
jgi:BirA family transcriptional regulator, biotin operon repressor / biotin---[acetyl-CoA-carboxylase] ligase